MEGIEGSGKSTLLSLLAAALRERGVDIIATREPGGTSLGNRLRATFVDPEQTIDPIAEAFVLNASRAQHVAEVIAPALAAGRFVLCDRFATATLAYQGYGRGVELETLRTLARIATRGCEPDLVLLVDVDASVSARRVARRAHESGVAVDRLEREAAAFHERVRAGYLALARSEPNLVTLDGTLAPPELARAAMAALEAKFST